MKDPHTRESRGFGFVNFELNDDANAAMAALNGTTLDDKTIGVEKARRGRARTRACSLDNVAVSFCCVLTLSPAYQPLRASTMDLPRSVLPRTADRSMAHEGMTDTADLLPAATTTAAAPLRTARWRRSPCAAATMTDEAVATTTDGPRTTTAAAADTTTDEAALTTAATTTGASTAATTTGEEAARRTTRAAVSATTTTGRPDETTGTSLPGDTRRRASPASHCTRLCVGPHLSAASYADRRPPAKIVPSPNLSASVTHRPSSQPTAIDPASVLPNAVSAILVSDSPRQQQQAAAAPFAMHFRLFVALVFSNVSCVQHLLQCHPRVDQSAHGSRHAGMTST